MFPKISFLTLIAYCLLLIPGIVIADTETPQPLSPEEASYNRKLCMEKIKKVAYSIR